MIGKYNKNRVCAYRKRSIMKAYGFVIKEMTESMFMVGLMKMHQRLIVKEK